jgi:hypothetical protein
MRHSEEDASRWSLFVERFNIRAKADEVRHATHLYRHAFTSEARWVCDGHSTHVIVLGGMFYPSHGDPCDGSQACYYCPVDSES